MSQTGVQSLEVLANELATVQSSSELIQNQIIAVTKSFQLELKRMQEHEKQLRDAILQGMKNNGVKKFENELLSLTYIAPTQRESIDVAALRAAEPELAKRYTKTSVVKEQLRIKLKEES